MEITYWGIILETRKCLPIPAYIDNAHVWLGRVTEYHNLKKEGKKDTMNYKHFREVIPSLDLEENRRYGTI